MEETGKTTSTYEKAVIQDKEARKALKEAKTKGEKLRLMKPPSLTSLFYEGTKQLLLLDFHGGGFCFKSPLDNDEYCSFLNRMYGFNVLNFDFSSSAKGAYPTQILEAEKQYRNLLKKRPDLSGCKLFIVGHSSGGNLAAALTLLLRREGIAVSGLLLDYPLPDLSRAPASRPVYQETFPDWLLDDWTRMYCPSKELLTNPLVSPLLMSKEEAALFPPTYVVTSETDRLHDDGLVFAELLKQCGVPSEHFRAQERHGFIERHMRNVYLTPENPSVVYAKKITIQSFNWLLSR